MLADASMLALVEQIKDDQWDTLIPSGVASREDGSLRENINYMAYDEAWIPDTLAGKTIAEVGTKYDGDLLGDDAQGNYRKYYEAAQAALAEFGDYDKQVHLTYGDFKASDYFTHIALYRCFKAYDLAKILGFDTAMSDELVQGMTAMITPIAQDLRTMGVFGPAVEVPADASDQDKLLGLAGREPEAK